ncbi:30S ribosomal protein S16 [Propionibacteriaceae bacterium Y1923]|uniref:30S ribosomal protein S16 n=1 Tax=Aestuariimicrobium sp. Y1814 TaxID=3418742 RepID=UPI003C1CB2CF
MATKIRLKRLGKIRSPHYRIIVIDERAKRNGKAIEEVGIYHPKNDPSVIQVNSERVQYWLGVGAQPTEAVVAILKRTGDWQQFSGDTSPSGVDPQPEKPNKLDLFNAALAEDDAAPKTAAITTKKAKEEAADEDAPAEDAPAEEPAAEEAAAEDTAEAEAPADEA